MLVGLSAESGPLFKARRVLIIKILMEINNTLWALHNKIVFGSFSGKYHDKLTCSGNHEKCTSIFI